MDRWAGKIALVTGANSGIGETISTYLARNGMRVVGVARRLEKLEEVRVKMGKVRGEFIPIKGDVQKEEDIEKVFQFVREKLGGLHVFINNAGIMRSGNILTGDLKSFKETFEVNVFGLVSCAQKAVKLMKSTGIDQGHIFLLGSVLGHMVPYFPDNSMNVYPASKFSVRALGETLRQEITDAKLPVKVTCLSPGRVRTEFVPNALAGMPNREDAEKFLDALPALEATDIADAVIYSLSTNPNAQVCDIIIRPIHDSY